MHRILACGFAFDSIPKRQDVNGTKSETTEGRLTSICARPRGTSLPPIRTIVVVEACQRLPKNRSSIDDLGFCGFCLRRGVYSDGVSFQRSGGGFKVPPNVLDQSCLTRENEAKPSRILYAFSRDIQ